eukprot:Hpha_TRINITY_DN7989_c0_g1::TRINITY_DN7989_c0_g1_i1::g.145992::m.145992
MLRRAVVLNIQCTRTLRARARKGAGAAAQPEDLRQEVDNYLDAEARILADPQQADRLRTRLVDSLKVADDAGERWQQEWREGERAEHQERKAGWKDEPCCIATDEFAYCDCSNEISCNCDVQPDSVGDALKYIVGIACPLMVLVGVFLSWLYPITPEKEIEVMAGLEARRGGSQVFGSASVRASLRLSVPVPSITQRVSRRSLPADLSKGGTEALRERADSLPHPIRV